MSITHYSILTTASFSSVHSNCELSPLTSVQLGDSIVPINDTGIMPPATLVIIVPDISTVGGTKQIIITIIITITIIIIIYIS